MPNELIWILFMLLDMTMVLFMYKKFGRVGLFAIIPFSLICANLQVVKQMDLFGIATTAGNIMYSSVFLATDLISEHYGKKSARQAVALGFITLVLFVAYMQIALLFETNSHDFAQPALETIFGFVPRIVAASMLAYIVSQAHDVWAFHLIKERTGDKMLWLRNNASTMVSQLLDTTVFCVVAFWGVFPFEVFLEISISTYIMKVIVAACDTPFMYLAQRIRPEG